MNLRDFWYVAAQSSDLHPGALLSRVLLGQHIVLFREAAGAAVALADRCIHRNAPLSLGRVENGLLRCGYHGWTYNGEGRVVEIPSLGDPEKIGNRCATRYDVREQEGYVYVRLASSSEQLEPFAMPKHGVAGYRHVRLVHPFRNTVTNCVENFVDVPHTAYVHPITFRAPRRRPIDAQVVRENGSVTVAYENEVHRGAFRWFLSPNGHKVRHTDRFLMPNVTSVEYDFGPSRHLFITSQSVPVNEGETIVYTDVTFNYGIWNAVARPLVARRARRIIGEDVEILRAQREVIEREGEQFTHSPIDVVHLFIESIRHDLESGRDPRRLPRQARSVAFVI